MGRDTSTGSDYEEVIRTCIERSCRKNRMTAHSQKIIGEKPGGGKHRVDWEIISIENPNLRGLVSCKFQKSSGTAEEKIAYEVIKLLYAMEIDKRYVHSWIVMGGTGWSQGMRSFVNTELPRWIPTMENRVSLMTTEELLSTDITVI